ncbi:hypothetical protein NPIL_218191 [Nephila pilipes]|uniref:Uncharacterized protein n=1 Tax=Nephila pilipes TaxID=299642 RepID=A0A8X6TUN3_NEPPI|nr:hypothetical protein NPIL_218191 [Nephila pilipes]
MTAEGGGKIAQPPSLPRTNYGPSTSSSDACFSQRFLSLSLLTGMIHSDLCREGGGEGCPLFPPLRHQNRIWCWDTFAVFSTEAQRHNEQKEEEFELQNAIIPKGKELIFWHRQRPFIIRPGFLINLPLLVSPLIAADLPLPNLSTWRRQKAPANARIWLSFVCIKMLYEHILNMSFSLLYYESVKLMDKEGNL